MSWHSSRASAGVRSSGRGSITCRCLVLPPGAPAAPSWSDGPRRTTPRRRSRSGRRHRTPRRGADRALPRRARRAAAVLRVGASRAFAEPARARATSERRSRPPRSARPRSGHDATAARAATPNDRLVAAAYRTRARRRPPEESRQSFAAVARGGVRAVPRAREGRRVNPLDPLGAPARGTRLIEASAGTGKTLRSHSLPAPAARARLEVGRILVVTYTNAATAELRSRIATASRQRAGWRCATRAGRRTRRVQHGFATGVALRDTSPADAGARGGAHGFDEAAIFTIHGFCQRVLQEHAFESGVVVRRRADRRPAPAGRRDRCGLLVSALHRGAARTRAPSRRQAEARRHCRGWRS